MSDSKLRALVQDAVEEAVSRNLGVLRSQLVEEISSRLGGLAPSARSEAGSSPALSAALKSIQNGTTQADILSALLQATESFAPRGALLVLRGGSVVAWRARGFSGGDPTGANLDPACPLVSRAMSQKILMVGPAAEFDSSFLARTGAPAGQLTLVPLLVREKVAALLYADSGAQSEGRANCTVDSAALDCLVRFAGTWIELAGVRKANSSATEAAQPEGAPAATSIRSASGESEDQQVEQPTIATRASASAADPFAPSAPGTVASPAAENRSADQAELQNKARRFARLLVDEIQLYNQERVEQGRRNSDLYARLKVEIEKSRAAYDRRYGQSLGDTTDYFQQELVRILANNNAALLGSRDSS
jgi:hypothetical protein